jgi:hypothetical protein
MEEFDTGSLNLDWDEHISRVHEEQILKIKSIAQKMGPGENGENQSSLLKMCMKPLLKLVRWETRKELLKSRLSTHSR